MDFITGFFVGLVWWEIAFVVLALIFIIISSAVENGLLFVLGTAFFMFYIFKIPFDLIGTLLYLLTGLSWAGVKFKFHIDKCVNHAKKYPRQFETKDDIKKYIIDEIDYHNVSFWIIGWPISFVAFLLKDFVNKFIDFLKRLYDKYIDKVIEKVIGNKLSD